MSATAGRHDPVPLAAVVRTYARRRACSRFVQVASRSRSRSSTCPAGAPQPMHEELRPALGQNPIHPVSLSLSLSCLRASPSPGQECQSQTHRDPTITFRHRTRTSPPLPSNPTATRTLIIFSLSLPPPLASFLLPGWTLPCRRSNSLLSRLFYSIPFPPEPIQHAVRVPCRAGSHI